MTKVLELQKERGQASYMSFEQKADALNNLFSERLIPFLREVSFATIEAQVAEQLYYQQTLEY